MDQSLSSAPPGILLNGLPRLMALDKTSNVPARFSPPYPMSVGVSPPSQAKLYITRSYNVNKPVRHNSNVFAQSPKHCGTSGTRTGAAGYGYVGSKREGYEEGPLG